MTGCPFVGWVTLEQGNCVVDSQMWVWLLPIAVVAVAAVAFEPCLVDL